MGEFDSNWLREICLHTDALDSEDLGKIRNFAIEYMAKLPFVPYKIDLFVPLSRKF
ncbi:hypothetical protein H6501_01445 [Candidatus Woesearchaeota archaeon]|nr:hypothetical protein [Nanoarchaeota archaeon]MCB9370240.1 hypothetical protein [Candidatus Woesearchaeota archaeon]USN44765.1 MAG: hypothetical protein H6500_02895 [Candidatus Woesearchaeota archaeon]